MKEYLVMECHPGYAVVLDREGRFLRVANLGYTVGQLVDEVVEALPPVQETETSVPSKRKVPPLVRWGLGAVAAGRVGPLFSKPVGHGSAGYGPRCGDPGEPPGTGDGDPAPERCGQCVAGGIFRPGESVGYGLRRTGRSGRPEWLLAGRGRRLPYGGERGYPMEAAHGDSALGAAGGLYGYYVAGPSGNAPEHSSSGKPAPVFHP